MDSKQRVRQTGSIDGFITGSRPAPPPPKIQFAPPPQSRRIERPVGSARPQGPSPQTPTNQPDFQRYSYTGKITSPKQASTKIKPGWSRRRKVLTSTLVILLIGFGIGSWYGGKLIANLDKVFHGNVFSDVGALFSSTKLKGEDQGRVNILLAGDSADDPGHQGADLTDSIMVLSIDTKTHTGFMLSIPRDLWVDIPGESHQKINAANDVTNFSQSGYPSGGMGQLEQIVQTDLGIPIDYYALINYQAFKQSVEAVGGITVNIQSPDPRGLYDAYTHLKLPNGLDTLDGQQALDLARARGDDSAGDVSYGFPQSDFDRTEHQRQMLVALAQKAETAGVVANPIKVTQLFDAFGNNIATDLTLNDALRLVQISKGINLSNLQSLTYSDSGTNALLQSYTDPVSGQEALIPSAGLDNFGQIQQYYQQLTSNNPVVREAPSVVVLNGSNVVGLAHKESTILQKDGFDVVYTGDATNNYAGTMVVDNTTNDAKPAARQLLQTLFPGSLATSTTSGAEAGEASGYQANFVVVLGQNWTQVP